MNKFLQTRIPYDTTYTIKDVLNECCNDIFIWINQTPEVEHDYEKKTVKNLFYKFMYKKYHKKQIYNFKPYDQGMYEYFSLKFSQDIINLFIGFKEITKRYNLYLFHTRYDISLDLEQFLFNILLIEDPYYDDCDEIYEENNISSIIDETNL